MQVTIKSLDDFARGITYNNEKITFIPNTLPEEIVDITITKETKKYQEATVNKIIHPHQHRRTPPCPYYNTCGGCQIMHTTYEETLKFKQAKIRHTLKKFTFLATEVSIIPSPTELNYRNKITLKIKDNLCGYYSMKTHQFIPITKCLIAATSINNFLPIIQTLNITQGEITIRSNYNEELLISITSHNEPTLPSNLKDYKVVGVVLNNQVIYGKSHFIEIINNTLYEISYDSFFQINTSLLPRIFNDIATAVKPNSTILDLYCGVGTLGLAARKNAKQIYGIEIIPNAILNAIRNAKMNKYSAASYHLGDVQKIIPKLNKDIDCILIDPPRKGLDASSIKTIQNIRPKQIIYMSCDVVTLARDLNTLKNDYEITSLTAYDMFPYTYHVECVCILNLLH